MNNIKFIPLKNDIWKGVMIETDLVRKVDQPKEYVAILKSALAALSAAKEEPNPLGAHCNQCQAQLKGDEKLYCRKCNPDTITLPRELVEKLQDTVEFAWNYATAQSVLDALNEEREALKAALQQPTKPV